MYCQYCDKEFPTEVTICPDCFADLTGQEEPSPAEVAPAEQDPAETYFAKAMESRQEEWVSDRLHPLRTPPQRPDRVGKTAGAEPVRAVLEPAFRPDQLGSRATRTSDPWFYVSLVLGLLIVGVFWTAVGRERPVHEEARAPAPVQAAPSAADLVARAQEAYDQGNFDEAVLQARDAVTVLEGLGGDKAELLAARELLARSYANAGETEAALRVYRELVEMAPAETAYAAALEQLQSGIFKGRRARGEQLVAEGNQALADGDAATAIDDGRDALNLFRDSKGTSAQLASAHRLLGRAYYAQGDGYQARMHFEKALAVDPADSVSRQALAALEQQTRPRTVTPRPTRTYQPSRTYEAPAAPRTASSLPKPSYPTARPKEPEYPTASYQPPQPYRPSPPPRVSLPNLPPPRPAPPPPPSLPRAQAPSRPSTTISLPRPPDFYNQGGKVYEPYKNIPDPNSHPPGY